MLAIFLESPDYGREGRGRRVTSRCPNLIYTLWARVLRGISLLALLPRFGQLSDTSDTMGCFEWFCGE